MKPLLYKYNILVKCPFKKKFNGYKWFSDFAAPRKRVTPISRHFKQIALKDYNINYMQVGYGNHAVFCFPGIVGKIL